MDDGLTVTVSVPVICRLSAACPCMVCVRRVCIMGHLTVTVWRGAEPWPGVPLVVMDVMVAGQTVVETGMIEVKTPVVSGQSVSVSGQLITVTALVSYTVETYLAGM